jgi:hypothetical protein
VSGGITSDGIDYLLNLARNGEPPVGIYHIALIQQLPPGFTIGPEEQDEPDYAEYSRGDLLNDSANWEVSDNTLFNLLEITFPTALNDWGQINYWSVCDQELGLGGRVLWVGQLDEPLFIEVGDQAFLAPGTLSLPMSGNQWAFG